MNIIAFTPNKLPDVLPDVLQWQDSQRRTMACNVIEYAKPEDDIILAFDGAELIGVALCQLLQGEADKLSSDVIYLAGLATKRPGYGKEFFRQICEYIKECGFDGVSLTSMSDVTGFYQSIGLEQSGLTFYQIWRIKCPRKILQWNPVSGI